MIFKNITKRFLFCLIISLFSDFAYSQSAITLDVQTIVPENYFGYNPANLVRPKSPNFNSQWLLDSVEAMGTNIIRYPAGTISNYWDWQTGFFDKDLPKGIFLPTDFGNNAYKNLDYNKLKTMVERLAVPPIFDINMMSKDKYYATAGLMNATGLNIPVKYIELGNELYDNLNEFEERFPTPESYIYETNQWAAFMKSIPGMSNSKIAVVGTTDAFPVEPASSRRNRWTAIAATTSNQYVDAVTLHHYESTSLGTLPIEKNIGLALSSAIKGFDNLSEELAVIGNSGKEAWVTEYNLFEPNKCAYEGFFHGLFTSTMALTMLQSPVITHVLCHAMVGSAEFATFYNDSTGFDISTSYNYNVNCAPNPIPDTKIHEKTALGVCMELVGDALKNAKYKRKVIFSNQPKLTANYNALLGYWFDGNLSTDMILINLDSVDRPVTIATSVFDVTNGKYIMVSPGPGGVLEPVRGAAKLIPGVYECKTSGIQNATQSLVLKKYSVTRIYVTKTNVEISSVSKTICSGSSTSVVARGGSGYIWNNTNLVALRADKSVMQFDAPIVTAPTIYKLKVTTAQGNSDSVSITVNPKPVLTVTSSATQVCKGAPVTLTATLTGGNSANVKTFMWFPSQYIQKSDEAIAIANPTKATTFRCYASDGVCFSANDSVPVVSVIPKADAGSDISLCENSLPATITALQTNGSSTYKWYDENGIFIKTGISASVSPILPSTYRLVVTSGTNACKDTAYVKVSPFKCCLSIDYPTQLTFNPGDSMSRHFIPKIMAFCLANPGHGYCTKDTLKDFTDEILFNGNFIADVDFVFVNCSKIRFAEKAQINFFYDAVKLTFLNCTLEAGSCSNKMWNGFYMEDFNATIKMDNCKVYDCENIIRASSDPYLFISNTKFDRFYNGIYLTKSSYAQQGWIYGNTFTQSATLKYPYSGKKSVYAIKLDNYEEIQIGDTLFNRNYFSNLQYGIISINTSLNVFNNKFSNITAWDTADSTNGTAILLLNTFGYGNPNNPVHLSPELYFKAGASFNLLPNKFEGCTHGIYALNARCEIKGNVFFNTKKSIELFGLTAKKTYILRNTISSADVGIDIIEPKLSEVFIENNTVSTNNQTSGEYMTPAIRVIDAVGQPCSLSLKSNVVNSGGTHGFYLVNSKPLLSIADVKVYLTNPNTTFTSYGFRFENIDSLTFKCNLVKATKAAYLINKIDISASFCPNAQIQCNTIDNAAVGIELLGNCNSLVLKNNDFKYLNDGLVIGAVGLTGGVIGPQPTSYSGAPARNMFYGKYISNKLGPNLNKGVFGHAATYAINSDCAGSKGTPKQFLTQYNDSLTIPYPNLKSGTNASAITPYLFLKLGKECVVNCLTPNPLRTALQTNLISDANLDSDDEEVNKNYKSTLTSVIPYLNDETTAWSVKSDLFNALAVNTNEMAENPDLLNFYNSLSNGNIGYISNLNSQIKAINNGGNDEPTIENKLGNIKQLNDNLIPENEIERTYKNFNSIYFKTLKGNYNLTQTDLKKLSKIAHSCPYIYGTSVFSARALYAHYSRYENYNDAIYCQSKYQLSDLKINHLTFDDINFELYPNPNAGQFSIQYDLTPFSYATIIFYNMMGEKVKSISLNVTTSLVNIDLENLVEGIYTYAVFGNNAQIKYGKVSIIK